MNRIMALLLIIMLAAVLAVNGCAVTPEPFDYHQDNELKQGPGLFSGEDGAFTIYRKPMASEVAKESTAAE